MKRLNFFRHEDELVLCERVQAVWETKAAGKESPFDWTSGPSVPGAWAYFSGCGSYLSEGLIVECKCGECGFYVRSDLQPDRWISGIPMWNRVLTDEEIGEVAGALARLWESGLEVLVEDE